jgi:hypothetical protein
MRDACKYLAQIQKCTPANMHHADDAESADLFDDLGEPDPEDQELSDAVTYVITRSTNSKF